MNYNSSEAGMGTRSGFAFCLSAVLLWSFNATLIHLGAALMGPGQFTGVVCLISGLLHLLCWRVRHGTFRNAVLLPAPLWLITIFGFALNVLTCLLAIGTCKTEGELCAVALINYLWPTLTVLLGVMLVPNTWFSGKLAMAIVLTFAGLTLANARQIPQMFVENAAVSDVSHFRRMLPYLLGLVAAISWAGYSAFLSRWRDWAKNYTTCGMGMLTAGAAALIVGLLTEGPIGPLTWKGSAILLIYILGPSTAGFLLWELAAQRTNVKLMGLMGAMIPVLSICWLCLCLRYLPGWEVILAAVLVSVGIVLSKNA